MNRYTRDQMAARVARDIPNGAYVNLGIGLPTLVANHLPKDREIILHTENGLLGMGPAPAPGAEDPDLINAGKQPVTALPGASFFHHADSFAMMRGGHLDCCVLGAFQVSVEGDLANWHTGAPDAIPAVGGAMDLAIGAKRVYVMMEHLTKERREQDRRAMHVSGHGAALRQPDLHRPGGDRRHAARACASSTSSTGCRCDELAAAGVPLRGAHATPPERMTTMAEAFICDAIRTPIGRYGGALSGVRTDDLARDAAAGADASATPASTGARSTTSSTAAPTRPARTTATSAAWRCCSPACRTKCPARRSTACAARASTRSRSRRGRSRAGESVADDRRRRREHDARAVRAWARPTSAFSRVAKIEDTTIGWRFVNPLMKAQLRHRLDARDRRERRAPNSASAAPTRMRSRCAASSARRRRSPPDGWPRRSCRSTIPSNAKAIRSIVPATSIRARPRSRRSRS